MEPINAVETMPMSQAHTDEEGNRWAEFPVFSSETCLKFENDEIREYFQLDEELAQKYKQRLEALNAMEPKEVYV